MASKLRTLVRTGLALAGLVCINLLVSCTPEPLPTPVITPLPTGQATEDVTASGIVVAASQMQAVFTMLGRVEDVTVAVGDKVEAGERMVSLDATDFEAAVAQAEAALATAQRERARLDAPPDPDAIAAAEANVRVATAAITQTLASRAAPPVGATAAETAAARSALAAAMADRRETFEAHEDTLTCVDVEGYGEVCPLLGPPEENARLAWHAAEAGLDAAQAEVDAVAPRGLGEVRVANADVALAQAQLGLAEAQLAQVSAPVMDEEVAVADAAVAEAQAALQAAEVALRRATLLAAMEGTVVDVAVEVGEVVQPGQPVLTLADLGDLRVETTDLSELDVGRVERGQAVTLALEAFDGREISGVVRDIAPRPELLGGDVVYTVTITLDEIPPELRLGMSAEVTIHVD
ncbi:MAG: efflux RND transporter periplasmic adaptor subunit [Anaerolineae bacterium]|nr:efflux RND transporter periplasmic adaptor subunit [Anaerolineae bacterium]